MSAIHTFFVGTLIWKNWISVEATTQSFPYLGCYADTVNGFRDLTGLTLTIKDFKVDSCINQCRINGYPYAGGQLGRICSCGPTYGLLGNSLLCNTTCDGLYCGGLNSNDIFYTIDSSLNASRRMVFYESDKVFDDARKDCVQKNGDIPSLNTNDKLEAVVSAIINATENKYDDSLYVWIGLKKRLSGQLFEWTDAYLDSYDMHSYDYINNWSPDDYGNEDCVIMNIKSKLWKSIACDQAFAYICFQMPYTEFDVSNQTETPSDGGSSSDNSQTMGNYQIVLYVVLPLFILCYGGSCVAFCVYKVYINCFVIRRRKPTKNNVTEKAKLETRKISSISAEYKGETMKPCCSRSFSNVPLLPKKSIDYSAPPEYAPPSISYLKPYGEFQPHKYFGSVSKQEKLENEHLSKLSKSAFFSPKRLKSKVGVLKSADNKTDKNLSEQPSRASNVESSSMHNYLKQQQKQQLQQHLQQQRLLQHQRQQVHNSTPRDSNVNKINVNRQNSLTPHQNAIEMHKQQRHQQPPHKQGQQHRHEQQHQQQPQQHQHQQHQHQQQPQQHQDQQHQDQQQPQHQQQPQQQPPQPQQHQQHKAISEILKIKMKNQSDMKKFKLLINQ